MYEFKVGTKTNAYIRADLRFVSKEMIVQFDLDDTGTISFEGFLAMISSLTAVMDIEKELHCGTVPRNM